MFSTAYRIASSFTRPVVISTRRADGTVGCGLGAFIVVNKDGRIVTAAHVLHGARDALQHAQEREEHQRKVDEVSSDTSLSNNKRRKALAGLSPKPGWITNQSLWWCSDSARHTTVDIDWEADVAILKLENFDAPDIVYPKFKDPSTDPPPAGSLCRLGYPFHQVAATFDEDTSRFNLGEFSMPPLFPNDGIHTRVQEIHHPNNKIVRLIETSTPGLRGQSGGPLFNTDGHVWGIQSRTGSLELGFTPKIKKGHDEIVEHQFLNVGLATHIQHAIALFEKNGVAYESA